MIKKNKILRYQFVSMAVEFMLLYTYIYIMYKMYAYAVFRHRPTLKTIHGAFCINSIPHVDIPIMTVASLKPVFAPTAQFIRTPTPTPLENSQITPSFICQFECASTNYTRKFWVTSPSCVVRSKSTARVTHLYYLTVFYLDM